MFDPLSWMLGVFFGLAGAMTVVGARRTWPRRWPLS